MQPCIKKRNHDGCVDQIDGKRTFLTCDHRKGKKCLCGLSDVWQDVRCSKYISASPIYKLITSNKYT